MFTKKERQIFRFYDGEKMVGRDPITIQTKLATSHADWEVDIALLRGGTKESFEAYDRLVSGARNAFGVKAFDEVDGKESGLLDAEVMEILIDYVGFLDEVKKKLEQQQSKPNVGE